MKEYGLGVKNWLVLLVSIFILSSCNENDVKSNQIEVLPEETQEGLNTMGALINGGDVWLPSLRLEAHLETYFTGITNFERIIILSERENNGFIESLTILHESDEIIQEGVPYPIYKVNNSLIQDFAAFVNSVDTYRSATGRITFTKFDRENNIISGTFEFDAYNDLTSAPPILFTAGRFDISFTRE